MSESTTESSDIQRSNVEKLQTNFNTYIDELHQWAGKAYASAGSRYVASGRIDNKAVQVLVDKVLFGFDPLYRSIPEGYHLDVGITPVKYYEAKADKDLSLLTRKEVTSDGPRYSLQVGRFVEDVSRIPPNSEYLNLASVGTNDSDRPRATFRGMMFSTNLSGELGYSLNPEDITSFKVAPNISK